MRRTATLSLDGFDPDVIEAAREVAQRAGVPLETWIESVVSPAKAPGRQPPNRSQKSRPASREPAVPASAPDAAQPATAPEPVAAPPAVQAEPAAAQPSPAKPSPAIKPMAAAELPGATIAEMMRRLDALDRSLAEDRSALREEAARAASLHQAPQADHVAERLAEIERRMGDLNAQVAAPRPLGRRGRPIAAEMREAVEDVRRRQRELDAAGPAPPHPAKADAVPPSPAIAELQAETNRLRESLGSLATGRDVGALEQAMRALADDVQRAREPAELAAPVEMMRRQVESLAVEFADNVHARLAGEVERLADRAQGSLASANHTDRSALEGVHRELDDIRNMIAGLAGPERIQSLAQSLHAISSQIADIQGGAGLRPLLEEIRSGIATPGDTRAILGRIDALAERIDHVDTNPVRDLIGRLETIGETLRRPAEPSGDLASMHALLHGLAEKVDRVGSGGGSLDALEQQVVALAERLETRTADPSVASLERTMGTLLQEIASLRDETSVEAAVERATRKAIAETIGAGGQAPGSGRVDAFRADLDDLRARQASADRRMQATMDSLNTVLSRLVDRLGMPETAAPGLRAARPDEADPLGEQLLASTALASTAVASPRPETIPVSAPRSRAVRRPEPSFEAAGLGDELLEPGAGRPAHGAVHAAVSRAASAEPAGDIKSSFIAAARRAAQAAQDDIAAEVPAAPERRDAPRPRLNAAASDTPGLVGRLLGGIEKRRRPLLLGLAAVVLVLGALQAFQMNFGGDAEAPAASVAAARPVTAEAPAAEAYVAHAPSQTAPSQAAPSQAIPAQAAVPASTGPNAGPQTTQSIAEAGPVGARPAAPARAEEGAPRISPAPVQAAIPQVASMASLGRDLSTVPASLASLKQAALDGDGAAIYELAAREADGRGMPRDLALAAKLYEKLAGAGYAPAQFKLGSFYEKGSGVIRDLGQAKTWYGRAADLGNIRAMHNLAVLNAENPSASGKPDFATAASWFRRAAEYGVRDSQYNLAVLYARGLGLGQDLVQSYAWFSAAAAQGDEEAGKKREDVAAKLAPKDLAAAKAVASAFRPKPADPSANEMPPGKASQPAAMSLLGAPVPGSPTASGFTPATPRTGV